jgi:dipeptidyl aminopeptidase/acylaminoacyl peptidase
MARDGIAVLTITQPGFGGSDGPWDFVGPRTITAVSEGIACFRAQRFTDSQRLALVGVSTGAMLAMFIAVQRDDICAAVLASGVYDTATWFRDWSESAPHNDLVATLDALHSEALPLAEALDLRSPIRLIAGLKCPVLIWHGGKDTISPIEQAYRLRDSLVLLSKPFETIFRPDAEHGRVPLKDVMPFLEKHLGIGRQDRKSVV